VNGKQKPKYIGERLMKIMRSKRCATSVASIAVILACGSATAETIDFEGGSLVNGTIVDEIFGDAGSGPIGVNADNIELDAIFTGPNNAAVIFESSIAPNPNDLDLGTPNEDNGGPGVGDAGPATNFVAQGNLLIINEARFFVDVEPNDLIDSNDMVTQANDADNPDAPITLDFSAIGPVSVSSIDLIDIELEEGPGTVTFFDAVDAMIGAPIPLPVVGDNGFETVDLGPTAGVMKMLVVLGGSGAIDNIVFDIPNTGGEGCTPGYWKQPHHFDSWVTYTTGQSYDTVFGVSSSFGGTLLDALRRGGGKEKALGRHAVAALLNTANSDVSYEFSEAEVISTVQAAYASGDFNDYKDILAHENEMGCPLN
jgi:hypothetical protein